MYHPEKMGSPPEDYDAWPRRTGRYVCPQRQISDIYCLPTFLKQIVTQNARVRLSRLRYDSISPRTLMTNGVGFQLLSKASLDDCWCFFCGTAWSYITLLGGAIQTRLNLSKKSSACYRIPYQDQTLPLITGLVTGNFIPQKSPYRIIPKKQIAQFQTERHYDTFVIAVFLREAECSDRGYKSYYHGQRIFNILPFEELTQKYTADQMSLSNRSPRSTPGFVPNELCYGSTVNEPANLLLERTEEPS